jgi:polyphosphate kinase
MAMDERIASWWLQSDGTWTRHQFDESGAPLADIQDLLIRSRRGRATDA